MDPPKFDWKRVLKNTLTYGLALEIMFIGSGYYLYKEYKTNKEFRERVEEEYPFMTETYNAVSAMYLSVMPKQLRDHVLNIGNRTDQSTTNNNNKPTDK